MTDTALILVDIQNDYFSGGRWQVDGMEGATTNAAALLDHARQHSLRVVHIRHESRSDTAAFFRPDSEGARIHAMVEPLPSETVILKHRPNCFHQTKLHEFLREAGVSRLIIAGAMSQMCIDATTRSAVDLGYHVTVAHDACAGRSQTFNGTTVPAASVHAVFMAALNGTYAAVTDTASILSGAAGDECRPVS